MLFGSGVAIVGLTMSVSLGPGFLMIACSYLILQWAYAVVVKRVMILDVVVVASGFVLRAYAGGVAIDVEVSPWLILITFLLALFLALARRRHELMTLGTGANIHRITLDDYTVPLIDQMIGIVSAATLTAYMVYTASGEMGGKLRKHHLYVTVPVVVFGIFRYLYLVHRRQEGGDPARLLLKDRPLMLAVILWTALDIVLLYL